MIFRRRSSSPPTTRTQRAPREPEPVLVKAEDWEKLRQAGRINARILASLRAAVQPGVRPIELDQMARDILKEEGAESPFLGYSTPSSRNRPYPAVINLSVNEELVHAIPNKRVLNKGDVVTIDCGTRYQGLIVDSAITVGVGKLSDKHQALITATEEALAAAIALARPGRRVGDISAAIEMTLKKHKVNIPPPFGGHAVGYSLHGAPHVSNLGKPGTGRPLQVGMALAIEPMGMFGKSTTRLLSDGWTVIATDKSVCAHSEHTVLITEGGAEILTLLPPPHLSTQN